MHRNNINLLRLLAAGQVVVSHMIGHLGLAPSDAPLVIAIRMFPGVPIFFLLSGYLIYKAWERDRNIWNYWTNRMLRIFPALWAAFGVTLAILFWADQFDGTIRETGLWIIAQLTVFQFYNPDFLRDYGVGVVNGALWSIPVEIQFYILLPLCALLFRRLGTTVVAVLLTVGINVVYFQLETENFVSKLMGVSVIPYLAIFFIGILFARYERLMSFARSVHPFWFLLLYAGLYLVAASLFGYNQSGRSLTPLAAPALALLVFSLAFRKKWNTGWFERNDISYGLYLYHMIFINLALYLGLTGFTQIALVIVCTFLAAIVSWLVVEKPALLLKRHAAAIGRKPKLTGTTPES